MKQITEHVNKTKNEKQNRSLTKKNTTDNQ